MEQGILKKYFTTLRPKEEVFINFFSMQRYIEFDIELTIHVIQT